MKPLTAMPKQLTWITLAVFIILMFCTYLLRQITTSDFFWHLKTGEWIWQNGRLPTADPFTFTGPQTPTPRQLFILQGYPLAQLLYYGLYETWGWAGIYCLRFVLAASFLLVFMARFALSGWVRHSWVLAGGLFLIFGALLLDPYPLDRPHVFSFLFFSVLLLLYEWLIRHGYQKPLTFVVLPTFALMAIWGNTHGGSLLGLAILTVIFFAETILFVLKRRERQQFLAVLGFALAGFTGCFLNGTRPDVARFYGVITAKTNKLMMVTNEYYSMFEHYQQYSKNYILFFAGFLAFTLILMVFCRQLNKLGEILILLAVGVNACLSLRYMPFFIVAAIPFIYEQLIRPDRLVRLKYVVAVAGVITFALSDAAREFDNASMLKKDGAVSQGFPIAATDFMIAANLQGNIFNPYQWGGYLLWRLAPERKIFQDSRALDEQVVMDGMSTMINMRGHSGAPLWQEIMDKYNINVVILPKFNEYVKGDLYKLTYDMVASPQWEVLYGDQTAVVFGRVARPTSR